MYLVQNTRIIVRPGGKLVVDGGTLTSACPGEMWQGIEVVGDRNKRQLPQWQGSVELKNGAVIENAVCGIRTGLREDTVNFATTGGIIKAENTTFRNNLQSVLVNSYAYIAPAGTVADNVCAFENCTFTVDTGNRFAANNLTFSEHVRLWDVKGVRFLGCDFENRMGSSLNCGRGIYADDAGVVLDVKCAFENVIQPGYCGCPPAISDSCSFHGFSTAVEVNTSGNPYAVSADRVKFDYNGTGFRVNANNFVTLTRCVFNLDNWPGRDRGNVGLWLENSHGYTVEENTFGRTTYPTGLLAVDNSKGISVSNSGLANNSLYRNNFHNLTNGIFVSGMNGDYNLGCGLQMTCNYFNGNKYDIRLASGATVRYNQGNSTKGADNEFHASSNSISNFYNPGQININYYYYNGDVNLFPANSTGLNLTTVSSNNSCAPAFYGTLPQPPYLFADFQSGMDDYATAMADNANTDEMEQDMRQALSETYCNAVRAIMADSLLDIDALEQWHTAAQPIGDPYSLTETRLMMGYSEPFVAEADDAELSNYAEFHAMKLSLRNNDGSVGADDDSSNSPTINWYALTPAQIAQLQTIAERNTGRASVMAKGVLCFFHGICYEDEDFASDDNTQSETRALHSARSAESQPNDHALTVSPNPTDDLLFVELSNGTGIAHAALYDLQGRVVETLRATSLQGATTLSLNSVPAGVYVLRVTDTEGRKYHRKIVKK